MTSKKFRILVPEDLGDEGLKILREATDVEADIRTGLSKPELLEILGDYDAIITRSGTSMDKTAIDAAKKLFEERGYPHISLETDGCVSFENAVKMKTAGTEIYVTGTSSVFKKDSTGTVNLEKNIHDFLKIIE